MRLARAVPKERVEIRPAKSASFTVNSPRPAATSATLIDLHQAHGNRFVQRMLNSNISKCGCNVGGTATKCDQCQNRALPPAPAAPQWLNSNVYLKQGTNEEDARFPWELTVTAFPCNCNTLRWEQFVYGGFTVYDAQGNSRSYSACGVMQQINPLSRRFGNWCDDLLSGMQPGPRSVNDPNYKNIKCKGSDYTFYDAPGFSSNFGDVVNGLRLFKIRWDTQYEHKLYCSGTQPFFAKRLQLTGSYDMNGIDTRAVR